MDTEIQDNRISLKLDSNLYPHLVLVLLKEKFIHLKKQRLNH